VLVRHGASINCASTDNYSTNYPDPAVGVMPQSGTLPTNHPELQIRRRSGRTRTRIAWCWRMLWCSDSCQFWWSFAALLPQSTFGGHVKSLVTWPF